MSDPNKPSTSTGAGQRNDEGEKDEIVSMWKDLDEKLEDKANSLNLTAINVKSILHHLIKNPHVISVLMGLKTGVCEIPGVTLTRSKTKSSKEATIRVHEDGEKSFLEENYEDDDDDVDYEPGEKSSEEDEEEEEEVELELETAGDDPFDILDREDYLQERSESRLRRNLNETSDHQNDDFLTFDVPEEQERPASSDYLDFLYSIQHPDENSNQVDEDDPEDEEYNVMEDGMDLDVEDIDETRNDRATMIPKQELKNLILDVLTGQDVPTSALPPDHNQSFTHRTPVKVTKEHLDQGERFAEKMKAQPPTDSCSLLKGPVKFLDRELDQLCIQLEQHVQLLTQNVVLSYYDKNHQNIKNISQEMINDIDTKFMQNGTRSFFNIPNLGESILTCHECIKVTKLPDEDANWMHSYSSFVKSVAPRPEAVLLLSRSRAILYPYLVPKVQPALFEFPVRSFLKTEDAMLAVALLQFCHLPRTKEKILVDRYTAIHENCLPSRPPEKIRNHMKNFRSSGSSNPAHLLITQAERGDCNFYFTPKEFVRIVAKMEDWPPEQQPYWFQPFLSTFAMKSSHSLRKRNPRDEPIVCAITSNADEETEKLTGTIPESLLQVGNLGERPILVDTRSVIAALNQMMPGLRIEMNDTKERGSEQQIQHPEVQPEQMIKLPPLINVELAPSTAPRTVSELEAARAITQLAQGPNVLNTPESFSLLSSTSTAIPQISQEWNLSTSPLPSTSTAIDMNESFTIEQILNETPKTPEPREDHDFTIFPDPSDSFLERADPIPSTSFHACPKTPTPREDSCTGLMDFPCESLYQSGDATASSVTSAGPTDFSSFAELLNENRKKLQEMKKPGPIQPPPAKKLKSDELPVRFSKAAREQVGEAAMNDEDVRNEIHNAIARRICVDVKNRLFMHQDMWKQLCTILSEGISIGEKVRKLIDALSSLPDVLALVLLYAPEDHLPTKILNSKTRLAYRQAIDMMIDIYTYRQATIRRGKTSTRQIFKNIAALDKRNPSEAVEHFKSIFDNEGPLWNRLKKNFHSLPYDVVHPVEDFEFIDMTKESCSVVDKDDHYYEIIDDVNQILGPSEHKGNDKLMVKNGQLWSTAKGSSTPIRVLHQKGPKKDWNKEADFLLLTTTMNNENADLEEVAEKLKNQLPFKKSEIIHRLNFLLSFIK